MTPTAVVGLVVAPSTNGFLDPTGLTLLMTTCTEEF
jgi:hypothetical protein